MSFFVIIEHVKPTFEVGEADRHSFDTPLVCEVLSAALLRDIRRGPLQSGALRLQIQLFQLVVGDLQKIAQRRGTHRLLFPIAMLTMLPVSIAMPYITINRMIRFIKSGNFDRFSEFGCPWSMVGSVVRACGGYD